MGEYTRNEVLHQLENSIAQLKNRFDETEMKESATPLPSPLERDLTSYEIVANSEQQRYPVKTPHSLHQYLIELDLKDDKNIWLTCSYSLYI